MCPLEHNGDLSRLKVLRSTLFSGSKTSTSMSHVHGKARANRRGISIAIVSVITVCVILGSVNVSHIVERYLSGRYGNSSEEDPIIVYNKPRKTGSSSLAELLRTQIGGEEKYWVPAKFHNDYLLGLNIMAGARLFVQHRSIPDDALNKLRELGKVILVTSTREPMQRWLSEFKQLRKLTSTQPIDWDEFGRWMRGTPCDFHLNYHSGKRYDCSADATDHYMTEEARKIVRRYDVVLDLDHIKQSRVVAMKMLGIDLAKIPMKNVRQTDEEEVMPKAIEEKLREKTRFESVLHREMLVHLALNYQAITKQRCVVPPADTSACWRK